MKGCFSYLKSGGDGISNFFFAVVVTVLVFGAVTAISAFSSIGGLLVPIPVLYYYSKLGRIWGILAFVAALLIVGSAMKVLGFGSAVFHFFFLGSLGFILSEVLRKSYSIEKSVAYSVIALLVIGSVLLLCFSLTLDAGPLHLIKDYISKTVQEKVDMYSQIGVYREQVDLIKQNTDKIVEGITMLLPSFVLVGTSFFVWFNILAGRLLFQRRGMWYPDFGDLSRWKIPDKTVWLFIASVAIILTTPKAVRILALNIFIILIFLYLLQGLSIVSFFFKKKNVPQLLRIFGYLLIFIQQFLPLLVAGLGLVDVWADFRKLGKAENQN